MGPSGQAHAFEPLPVHYQCLERLAALNPVFRIFPVSIAAGNEDTVLPLSLSNDGNTGWNTLVSGFMPFSQVREEVMVRVRPFDAYIAERGLTAVHFIKIDTEGFEILVLEGLHQCMKNHRPVIQCEIAPTAYPLLGKRVDDLQDLLRRYRYSEFDLSFQPVLLAGLQKTTNVLFLPRDG